jgi:hypothetical protein
MFVEKTGAPLAAFGLGQYIAALIEALGAEHPAALARMREVVGSRRARIRLDNETVDVAFRAGRLSVEPAANGSEADGHGATDSVTVLALLDGEMEVGDAILEGRLSISGTTDNLVRMLVAIEILLDASPRTPALLALAARFYAERKEKGRRAAEASRKRTWYPFTGDAAEHELLSRLDLLPDSADPK